MNRTPDALFATLYARAADGDLSDEEALSEVVRHVASATDAVMVSIAEETPSSAMAMRAASREARLWLELQRLPERSEGTVTGQGPAAMALRLQKQVWMPVTDAGFSPWKKVAVSEGVAGVHAWPIRVSRGRFVLELFVTRQLDNGSSADEGVTRLLPRLEHFLAHLATMRRQQLLAQAMDSAGTPAFITDRNGTIVWANEALARRSGYPIDELEGGNPRLLQSGEHGVRYYRELWDAIRRGEVWQGETVEHDRAGREYAVRQTVSPVVGDDATIHHYLAVHVDITGERVQRVALESSAKFDERTGLLTPSAFRQKLEQLLQGDAATAQLSLVLVSLRPWWESLAGTECDESREALQRLIANRLRLAIPPEQPAAGMPRGDYVVQLPRMDDAALAEQLQRLKERIGAPLPQLPEDKQIPEVRIAVAHAPADGTDYQALARSADRHLADAPARAHRRRLPPNSRR